MDTSLKRPAAIERAIDGLTRWSTGRMTRPGIVIRRALGNATPEDEASARQLANNLRAETRMDGSVRGEFLTTAWRAIELMDLDHAADQAGTVRVIGYLLTRQDEPGAYGGTNARPEHRGRTFPGFFSPGDPGRPIAPLTLPNGATFTDDADARYAVSCIALRAALKARLEKRPQIQQHTESLAELARHWGGPIPLPLACSTLHGLALAEPPMRDAIPGLIERIAAGAAGGAWADADLFHVLQALLAVPHPEATTLIQGAMPALIARQAADGGFDGEGAIGEERAWIATRALLRGRQG